MLNQRKINVVLFLISITLYTCKTKKENGDQFHFTLLDAGSTHIDFSNVITESDSVNVFVDEYLYNGSGVGIADFNNDSLPDIFFCGSMVSSRLFLNKGGFQFEDITAKAGLSTNKWCTGVSIVDINSDGFQDIYVCASHSKDTAKRTNLLFINDGKLHFTEQAAAYGLADTGFSTQAAFFDYDRDGDADMYLLNHRIYSNTANYLQPKDTSGHSIAADRLYKNEGVPAGSSHPVFRDVSVAAGIKEDGYGLGVVITDVNNDNWPDIYVANDYIANDLLWLNNGNGSFSNTIAASMRHQSYNSMGVDAADINNDGLPDIATVDMLPENNERKKMMLNSTNQDKYDMQVRFGYQPSYMRNMLQVNNGNRMINQEKQPFYSEIGQLAGISETDWSWSVLMTDFDNDGWKDIYITNGLGKDVTNNDYATFRETKTFTNNYTFGVSNASQPGTSNNIKELREEIDEYGSVKMENYFFHNKGDLTFSNMGKEAGLATPSISNGAAYADLDNDGDLDLVVNNINEKAFIYRNEIRKRVTDSLHNFLCVQLKGPAGNAAIGCKLSLFSGNLKQCLEQSPVRGFESSVDQRLHFGIGNAKTIDSLKIQWPDGKIQWIKNIPANRFIVANYKEAAQDIPNHEFITAELFTDISDRYALDFKHAELQNYDFGIRQPLKQRYSQMGPCLATADINGDGLMDFFCGGAANQSGKIFTQQKNGGFIAAALIEGLKPEEDLGAVFFDADGDKDPDLLITGGSMEFITEKYNQPRLYINNKGHFILAPGALPEITVITKAVTVADYDADGDMDVFIGGRLFPNKYPQSPRSYILENEKGKFIDVTRRVCPYLELAGMVEAAVFTDLDNDKKPDLLIAGEYMPLRFFKNENNQFTEITNETGLKNETGWWRSLEQADIDRDGDMDYIAGNIGLNNKYHPSAARPMLLYAKDMDGNGSVDLLPAYYIKNNSNNYKLYPEPDRNQLSDQVPSVKKKYLLHKNYSTTTLEELKNYFGGNDWLELKCETFSTIWIENLGNGKFSEHELPIEAQWAPVNSIAVDDINKDGYIDLVFAGNEYQSSASIGRYDASYSLVMKGDGKGNFVSCPAVQSGLIVDGDVKAMRMISLGNKSKVLLIAPNDSRLKLFLVN